MNVLVIGSGAREHIILKTLSHSPQQPHLYCYGSHLNPGIDKIVSDYWVGDLACTKEIVQIAQTTNIDLVVVGPEIGLEGGLADALWEVNIPTIGPKKSLARLETNKGFARQLMHKYAIPGLPRFESFQSYNHEAEALLLALGEGHYVIKANGLMGGKGVKVSGEHLFSLKEAKVFCNEIVAKNQGFLIEEKLVGPEFSLMCFADGNMLIPMPLVQDYKRAFNDNKGPNTGGMGSYSQEDHGLPFLSKHHIDEAFNINQKVYQALMSECQEPYIGILYGSYMLTDKGIYVIEFNARFGDPEVLNVLSLLKSDLLAIFQAMVKGTLAAEKIQFAQLATVCKYAVPLGYPDAPLVNQEISFADFQDHENWYFASVQERNGKLLTGTSRALAYVGIAENISRAEKIAQGELSQLQGSVFYRSDIGVFKLLPDEASSR